MFIVSKAAGPAFLMVIFLVLTILCHISLAKALNPLLYSPPLSLQFQDHRVDRSHQRKLEDGQAQNGVSTTSIGASKRNVASNLVPRATDGDQNKVNFVSECLKLWIYADHATVDQLVRHEGSKGLEYPQDAEAQAYLPPSVTSQTPFLWIPADDTGISKQEVLDTGKVAPISNKGCKLNKSNRIQWDTDRPRPPDWCEKISY
jgi:hypothetical protein